MKELLELIEKKRWSLGKIAFCQASAFIFYVCLVSLLLLNVNKIFGNTPNFFGPVAFLTLFVFSAIISGFIVLGYPFFLFWEKKDTKAAMRLVFKTAEWLFAFLIFIFTVIAVF